MAPCRSSRSDPSRRPSSPARVLAASGPDGHRAIVNGCVSMVRTVMFRGTSNNAMAVGRTYINPSSCIDINPSSCIDAWCVLSQNFLLLQVCSFSSNATCFDRESCCLSASSSHFELHFLPCPMSFLIGEKEIHQ